MMDSKHDFTGRIVILSVAILHMSLAFSQDLGFRKDVFIYKKIQGHEIKANIFIPNSEQNHPVLVYFHGGGFVFGNRDIGLEDVLRDTLLAHQYAVVSADYRLAPETKLDEILRDVSDIIGWLRKDGVRQFHVNPGKIGVAGGSAGGYLALSTGYNVQPPPQAIIAISTPTEFSNANTEKGDESILEQPGPYDVVSDTIVSYGDYDKRLELWRFLAKHRLALSEIFGFDVSQDTSRLHSFMLTKQVTSAYPPVLLVHARNDHLVPLQVVKPFEAFLKEKGVESELCLVENGHSSRLIRNNPEAVEKIVSFLDRYLK